MLTKVKAWSRSVNLLLADLLWEVFTILKRTTVFGFACCFICFMGGFVVGYTVDEYNDTLFTKGVKAAAAGEWTVVALPDGNKIAVEVKEIK